MENLGAMADSRYTGFRKITDRDVLELHCIKNIVEIFREKLLLRSNFSSFPQYFVTFS